MSIAGRLFHFIAAGLFVTAEMLAAVPTAATTPPGPGPTPPVPAEHVILFVLEGFDRNSLKDGPMPNLGKLVKDGSVTWSASGVTPALRLPTMASLITGMPVEKHGITWNFFEISRGYYRVPSLFDYLDVGGGRDSAIFYMDESLYQLAKPAPYTDHQLCGALRPECDSAKITAYIEQYLEKATSGHGYGHATLAVPDLLLVHLPEAGRAGVAHGWNSKEYKQALRAVDGAIRSVLDLFKHYKLSNRTVVVVTALSGRGSDPGAESANTDSPTVPWIASGSGIKPGQMIRRPVSIIDTGATVMRMLGLDTHTEWDSKSIDEIFQVTASSAGPSNIR
ncbi:MAG: alkaline phosphatase family protein [Nitrospira sp.]|nr:alkaline phosphatase family protein [Nitrospira sp.]